MTLEQTLVYSPVQRRADLDALLAQSGVEAQFTLAQLAECNFFFLQELAAGKPVSLAELATVQSKYPQALLNGKPEDPETLASVLRYVGDRLPTKVFRPGVQLKVHSRADKTMATPHVYDGSNLRYRKKAPARSRWTIIDSTDEEHPIVNFQLRDSAISDQTDGFEVLSWLGSLEQVRQTARQLILEGKDCKVLITTLSEIFKSHIEAELEMLNKRLAVEVSPNENNQPIDEAFIIRATERVTALEKRLKHNPSQVRDIFFDWINRDGTQVFIQTEQPGDLQVTVDRTKQHDTVARKTAELVAQGLEKHDIAPITDVFYGNDFTLRIFLSLGLFNDAEWRLMEIYFAEKYAVVAQSIELITDPDMREAARKFFFVQQLSLYKGNFTLMSNLKQRLFSPETFKQIGITRIVQTKDSPTADPIDVIVPENIDVKVFEQLPKAIQLLIQKIIDNQQVILSTAYPLGHLTAMLSEALRQLFPTINAYAFAGKVGLFSDGSEYDKVGELMFPTSVVNQLGDDPLPVVNDLPHDAMSTSGFGVRTGTNLTTLALTAQDHFEMAAHAEAIPGNEALSLDVELYPFMEWVNNLPTSIRANIAILLGYYFSDKSIPPDKFNQAVHGGDKISEKLGLRGSVPVFLSFYAILDKMAEKSHPKSPET